MFVICVLLSVAQNTSVCNAGANAPIHFSNYLVSVLRGRHKSTLQRVDKESISFYYDTCIKVKLEVGLSLDEFL